MRFTQNEMQRLHVGETFGPFMATAREVHCAQANISAYRKKYPGAEFKNMSKPFKREDERGRMVPVKGYYNFSVTRISTGVDADTGEKEKIV